MQFTTEQIKKAKQAKSAEEIVEMAKAESVEMTNEQAKVIFDMLNKCGELSDEELSTVAGGSKGDVEDVSEPQPKEPQEYFVKAGWAPTCNGNFFPTKTVVNGQSTIMCCGCCKYFKHNATTLYSGTEGVCRREFK